MKSILKLSLIAMAALALFAAPSAAQGNMSTSLYGGYANMTGEGSPDGSFGVRGNLLWEVSPVIGVGPELGYYSLGSIDITTPTPDQMSFSAIQGTGQIRVRGVTGTMRPYGMGGLGMYSTRVSFDSGGDDNSTNFGFNLGGGMQFGTGMTTFGVEGRWHSISTEGESTDMITFMGGVNFH